MAFTLAGAMRRALKSTRARRSRAASKAMKTALGGAMFKTVVASVPKRATVTSAKPKLARKPRKPAGKTARKTVTRASPSRDRRLSTVLKQLRAARALLPDAAPAGTSKPPFVPKGAQYLDRTHTCAAGIRDFKLYLPARHPRGPKGLIVMLHGCSQDPNDFATGTHMNRIAQRHGLAVAYPAQTRTHNAASCWNWYNPASQARGAGEPAIIASLARKLTKEFGLDRSKVFVAGLSAGGAMAAILADTYPDVFSAAGVHSGLPRGAASGAMSALSAMRNGADASAALPNGRKRTTASNRLMRRIVFHGDGDSTVHPSNAPQIVAPVVGERKPARVSRKSVSGRDCLRSDYVSPDGTVDVELWQIKGTGHAWSGGTSGGSFTDPRGPDASREMVRFFLSKKP